MYTRLRCECLEERALLTAYTLTYLGVLGGSFSNANGINQAGDVAGVSSTLQGYEHAVLWHAGTITDLGTLPGGQNSWATSINNHGDIVGYSTDTDGNRHAVLWQGGQIMDLGTDGATESYANAINDAGEVVGTVIFRDAQDNEHYRGFTWQNGVMTLLDTFGGDYGVAEGLNRVGVVVGGASVPANWSHAYLNDGDGMTDLGTLGGFYSIAGGINDDGTVVGYSTLANGATHAALWRDGQAIDLGTLGGDASGAVKINNHGTAIGWSYTDGDRLLDGWVLQDGQMTDLNGLLVGHPDYAVEYASGINNHGAIAAQGFQLPSGGNYAILLKPVVQVDVAALVTAPRRDVFSL